ncbi:Nagb/rpia/CoA transferase-like protein [Pleurostoma richardsiae]|uniref:Nagb/rpia/CoA transferase-like protein n=1 Tax=Pleurostoma richardsiae TaxID=41990 RepID=A0AA38RDV4_9PEZI|nr:Nagb/rpia/CoA transferase-like protein [Pleurostoma richardsiae]
MATVQQQQPQVDRPLKKRSVVSNFIYEEVKDGDATRYRVALFRRSDKVSTYQHHLAPISGSIDPTDPTPLAAAWRELHEETTLDASSLELTRQGKPYSFGDPSVGREWTIYAFAYRLRGPPEGGLGPAGIHIDWEHEGWGWYEPRDIVDTPEFGGVPRLAESFRRVWFERDLGDAAGAVLRGGLARLKGDHQSGARQLAGVALRVLRGVVAEMDAPERPSEEWWAKVRFAAWHVWKNGRESMGAAIMSVLLAALKGVEEALEPYRGDGSQQKQPAKKWHDAVLDALDERIAIRERSTSAKLISEAFVLYLNEHFAERQAAGEPIKILTLSESSTITACLRHALLHTDYLFDLRVLESRPLYEGVSLAASVVKEALWVPSSPAKEPSQPRLTVTLFTDASAALAASSADVVLLGADRVASSGAVSNKTGSLPAVLSAKHVSAGKCRTVVLSESEKVAPPGSPAEHVVEDNDAGQLVEAWQAGLNSERVRQAAGTLSQVRTAERSAAKEGEQEQQQQEQEDQGGGSVGTAGGGAGAVGGDTVRVEVRNVFFEWVPAELVDGYVTENGLWTVDDIEKHSAMLGAEQERLFGDL